MRKIISYYLFVTILAFTTSCGDESIFSDYEDDNPKEDAAIALENDNPDKAIKILNDALVDEPNNYAYISLLSAATAQKYGVDAITIALELADTENASSSNNITALFSVLPDPTTTNIAGITSAINYLNQIPASSRTASDNFKMTLLQTSLAALRIKAFDTNNDGNVTAEEALQIDSLDTTTILTAISDAQNSLSQDNITTGDGSSLSTESITNIKAAIDAQEGADETEKLRNYLEALGS